MRYRLFILLFCSCSTTTKYVMDSETVTRHEIAIPGGSILQYDTVMKVHDLRGRKIVLSHYPPYNFANEFYRLKVGDTILYLKKSNRISAVYIPTWRDALYPKVRGAWMIFNYCDDWMKYEPKCNCK